MAITLDGTTGITSPDINVTAQTTNFDTSGTIIASNISDGTTSVASTYVVNGSAKAWVNINQIGTQAIQDSFNISSITDINVGRTTVNLSNNMSNINYSSVMGAGYNSMQGNMGQLVGSVGMAVLNSSASYEDRNNSCIQIMGDLA